MGRVVLATMGSWGDIFPVIGLAKGLTEAGHDVRVAASPAYDELVQGEGLQFSGIGPALGFSDYARDPKILSGRLGGFVGFSHLFRRFIFPALDRYVDDLAASIRGADLLLAHPALIAAPVAAEHVGVRWATISVFPGLIPTAYAPPAPTRVSLGSGRAGRAIHRAAWRVARFNMARLFDAEINRARRRLGLAAVSNSFFYARRLRPAVPGDGVTDGDRPARGLAAERHPHRLRHLGPRQLVPGSRRSGRVPPRP